MRKTLIIMILALIPQAAGAEENPLERYIALGLENNLALRQQRFSLEKNLEVLREAKGMFMPAVTFQGRYTRAGGGRIITFPIGDILNPVYGSLNELYGLQGITANFPTDIPNERFPFLREEEQETFLRVVQPIFQPAIYHNYRIRAELADAERFQVDAFKRRLVTEIKSAYFTYLKTLKVVEILQATQEVLEENLRVSTSLVDIGKATEDVIYRARAEIADLEQKQAEAEKNRILAAQYFNFLINRDLKAAIDAAEDADLVSPEKVDPDQAVAHALENRDEFAAFQHAIAASGHQIGLARSSTIPMVSAVLDYGIQGEKYSLGKDDDFWMASVVFSWTLFKGRQNQAKKAQARIEKRKLEVQREELEKQISLDVREKYQSMIAAGLAIKAASAKEESAKRSFDIVAKKYAYGTAPQVAFLDARTTWTAAALNHVISRYEYLIRQAELEQASAWLDLNKYETSQDRDDTFYKEMGL